MPVPPAFQPLAARLRAAAPAPRTWPRLKRQAAIAVVLREGDAGFEVLLMRRVEREGDRWSGDVACPGGFASPGEDLVDCALRETEEEVGVRLERDALIGPLRLRPSSPWHRFADFQVAPYVFAAPPDPGPLVLEAKEVASARWIPLRSLARGVPREHFWWWWRFARPVAIPFRVDRVRVGDYDVWGLTLRILEELGDHLG